MNETTYEEKLEAIKRSGRYYEFAEGLFVQDGRLLLPNNTWIDYFVFIDKVLHPTFLKFNDSTREIL